MADWFGKNCEYLCAEWELCDRSFDNYRDFEPELKFCNHRLNQENTEGNCNTLLCPVIDETLKSAYKMVIKEMITGSKY